MGKKSNEDAVIIVTMDANKFAADFHKCLVDTSSGTCVVSAASAYMVLAMAACGADGSTAREMREALHLPDDLARTFRGFQEFVDTINGTPKVTLNVANKIFATYKVKKSFKKITGTYFREESEELDLKSCAKSAKKVNDWCKKKTKGQIQKMVNSDDMAGPYKIMLLNAVYFRGDWKHKFDPKLTKQDAFHLNKTSTVQVPMMRTTGSLYFAELNKVDAKVVALPYVNDDLYMVLIVPNEIDGLAEIEKNLDKIKLEHRNFEHGRSVDLSLPKFEITSVHDLKFYLVKLGMKEVFEKGASFRGICDNNVCASLAMQKVFIKVDEGDSGKEVVSRNKSKIDSMTPDPIAFKVDRPFLFEIVDVKRKITLFFARVVR